MSSVGLKLVQKWVSYGPRFMPFADAASADLPLSRLLRLSLFQVSVGMALVLLVGTLNRVMTVELRVPASLPYLFPSLLVGISAGLVGAIVGELPTGAQAGLGARLLTGSYYGNTVQIWSALVMAAVLGLALTGCVAWAEKALTPGVKK